MAGQANIAFVVDDLQAAYEIFEGTGRLLFGATAEAAYRTHTGRPTRS